MLLRPSPTTIFLIDPGFDFDVKCSGVNHVKEVIMAAINTPYATLSFASIFTPRPRSEGVLPSINAR
jgi:hypothetical protein